MPSSRDEPSPTQFSGSEPRRSIYVLTWDDAWRRAERLAPGTRPLFIALLRHIEDGWRDVRLLAGWYDEHRVLSSFDARWHALVDFVDGDVVDVYRETALEACALVPGWANWEEEADPGDVESEAECFQRYLALLALAVEVEGAPAELREITRTVDRNLHQWSAGMRILLAEINDRVMDQRKSSAPAAAVASHAPLAEYLG